MWTIPRIIGVSFLVLVMIYVFGFLATGGNLAIYRFWAPKQADAQREVFTHSQSYIQGKIQNLEQQCFAYNNTSGDQKIAFASEIRNEAATVNINDLPADERSCVNSAKGLYQ